ncbi:MAG: hypothetical protein KJO83_04625, partial [Bacteroidia bacterium]|nr:hypothetical protein [Bacteroidia bacterium]
MKKSFIYFLLGGLIVSTIAFIKAETKPAPSETVDSYISMINGVKAYTLELAEAMPADQYTF